MICITIANGYFCLPFLLYRWDIMVSATLSRHDVGCDTYLVAWLDSGAIRARLRAASVADLGLLLRFT